jgi:predicted nucleotidyltransferase
MQLWERKANFMPTGLELTREEWGPYIESIRRRPGFPAISPEEEQEREQLLARVKEAVVEMKKQFSVHRVVLFGSLAHRAWDVPDSDVDLAVEGLDPKSYWKAWGLVEDIIASHPVNLIDIKTAGESLREAIERDGVEL